MNSYELEHEANSLWASGDLRGALLAWNKLIDAGHKPARFYRGKTHYEMGDHPANISDQTLFISDQTLYLSRAHHCRGLSRCVTGDHQGNVEDQTAALGYAALLGDRRVGQPEPHHVFFWRGRSRYSLGDHHGNIEDQTASLNAAGHGFIHANWMRSLSADQIGSADLSNQDRHDALHHLQRWGQPTENQEEIRQWLADD